MSVVYRSWEMPSGPAITRKVKPRGSTCLKEDASYRLCTQQDAVISSLSSLSLQIQSPNEAYLDKQCDGESAFLWKEAGSFLIASSLFNGVLPASQKPVDARICPHLARQKNECASYDNRKPSPELWWPSTLRVVSEDMPWEDQCMGQEGDCESSLSVSLNETPVDSFNSDDSEAQSNFSGSADHLTSPETPVRPRKGLSRFYGGKSQSFSCLRDVTSVKDLAKPENPYGRKRKNLLGCNSSLRSTAAGISKKSSNASKCTLALGMAMGAEDCDYASILGGSWQRMSGACRSYSLSDLQRMLGNHF